jgi:hypothetical protein
MKPFRIPAAGASWRQTLRAMATLAVLACAIAGCSKHPTRPMTPGATRTYRMGFMANAPHADFALLVQAINLMIQHSDVAILSYEAPWDSLLAGTRPDSIVLRQIKPLSDYYRAHNLRVWVYTDPANGLNRAGEANPLVAAGRSITEPAIQQLYRNYCVALDTLVRPDAFGVALETNLIRAVSPAPLYAAVKQVANGAAGDIRAHDAAVKLSVSVQVETAWGLLPNTGGYQGVATDFADFPFVDVLGLSSYPYFAWVEPESLPANYYSRLVEGRTTPVAITEGGWTSENFSSVVGTPDKQRRYVEKQSQLLDAARAIAVFQLVFTDIEVAALSPRRRRGSPHSRAPASSTRCSHRSRRCRAVGPACRAACCDTLEHSPQVLRATTSVMSSACGLPAANRCTADRMPWTTASAGRSRRTRTVSTSRFSPNSSTAPSRPARSASVTPSE